MENFQRGVPDRHNESFSPRLKDIIRHPEPGVHPVVHTMSVLEAHFRQFHRGYIFAFDPRGDGQQRFIKAEGAFIIDALALHPSAPIQEKDFFQIWKKTLQYFPLQYHPSTEKMVSKAGNACSAYDQIFFASALASWDMASDQSIIPPPSRVRFMHAIARRTQWPSEISYTVKLEETARVVTEQYKKHAAAFSFSHCQDDNLHLQLRREAQQNRNLPVDPVPKNVYGDQASQIAQWTKDAFGKCLRLT